MKLTTLILSICLVPTILAWQTGDEGLTSWDRGCYWLNAKLIDSVPTDDRLCSRACINYSGVNGETLIF